MTALAPWLIAVMAIAAIVWPFVQPVRDDEQPFVTLPLDYQPSRFEKIAAGFLIAGVLFGLYASYALGKLTVVMVLLAPLLLLFLLSFVLPAAAKKNFLVPVGGKYLALCGTIYVAWSLFLLAIATQSLALNVSYGADPTPINISLAKDPSLFWISIGGLAISVAAAIRLLREWIVLRRRRSVNRQP